MEECRKEGGLMAKEQESCGNCRFERDGECHKGSPRVYEGCRVQLGRDMPAMSQLTAHTYLAQWPLVNLRSWCGDYEK